MNVCRNILLCLPGDCSDTLIARYTWEVSVTNIIRIRAWQYMHISKSAGSTQIRPSCPAELPQKACYPNAAQDIHTFISGLTQLHISLKFACRKTWALFIASSSRFTNHQLYPQRRLDLTAPRGKWLLSPSLEEWIANARNGSQETFCQNFSWLHTWDSNRHLIILFPAHRFRVWLSFGVYMSVSDAASKWSMSNSMCLVPVWCIVRCLCHFLKVGFCVVLHRSTKRIRYKCNQNQLKSKIW